MVNRRYLARLLGGLLALGMIAAACGDDGDAADPGGSNTGSTASGSGTDSGTTGPDEMTPQSGGSITISMFSETRGLDPTASSGSGTAGGTELSNIYDTITRWNPETREYDMRTAESVTPNDDFTEWTLVLKDGISFRDGTPYDAEAVRFNMERYLSPVNTSTSRAWLSYVIKDPANVTVVDSLTVNFKLDVADAGFRGLLAHTPGMMVSPTAVKALGDPSDEGYKAKFDVFNINPVGAGAGPFEVASFIKGEALTLKKDPNYWGGEPYLDEVKFVVLPGSDRAVDSLKTNSIQAAFLRTAFSVDAAKNDPNLDGVDNIIQAGDMLLVNQGLKVACKEGEPQPVCTGQGNNEVTTTPATANDKVRQAIALAIDPDVINSRVNNELGLPTTALFTDNFADNPGVPGFTPDPDAARKLVEEAKAEGFDGKVGVLCTNQPERVALGQTLETQLKAVGLDADVRTDLSTADQITEIVAKRNFDVACWGMSVPNDETAPLALLQNFWSKSPNNRTGYANPEWDAGLDVLLAASTSAERKAAYETMAELFKRDVPSIVFNQVIERIAWSDKVHGIYPNSVSMFFLDKAWIEQ